MNTADALRWCDYLDWANRRMMLHLRHLSPAQWRAPITSSFPSLHETVVHMVSAEWVWLERWLGRAPSSHLSPRSIAPADIFPRWEDVSARRRQWLNALTDDVLNRSFSYVNMKQQPRTSTFGDSVYHVVNHATYHRGQVITMLRQLQISPTSTDYTLYRDNADAQA